ncbi:PREDICTED: uncharacterized protein LOC104749438 [Camelina sativa]|uniref:Uncharacterized protein LOC104749438 n=1 Tax=Camelina sativa TaxID=90675 RepID=A0ABM0WD52_CAMSA|nr:PREDICTED: uncharacterized protein LOC104749438 [Camelina sativa]XP_010469376.1 PREDICTED: uncharacterized protein LOC104749438 [Camelina sativa]
MPPGSKKRKALKKKQQEEQESIGAGANNKGFNGHGNISGHDEHGSQDERESDGNLSSPGYQGNDEFGARDPSPSPPSSSGLGKVTVKDKTDVTRAEGVKGEDFTAVGRGTDHQENCVDKPPNSFPENFTHTSRKLASQEAGGTSTLEIAPAVDSDKPVVVMADKNEQVESSTDSDSVQQKSGETEEKRRRKEAKEGNNNPGSAAETSKEIKRGKESEVPECSEERSLMPSGPPVVRTSWLSCCGLFDVMTGSER